MYLKIDFVCINGNITNPHEGETSRGRNVVELEGVALGPKGRFAMQRTLTRVRPHEGVTLVELEGVALGFAAFTKRSD